MIPPGRYRVRTVEWFGEKSYPQGWGMTWDDIEIDIAPGEFVLCANQGHTGGEGTDGLKATLTIWIGTPVEQVRPTPRS